MYKINSYLSISLLALFLTMQASAQTIELDLPSCRHLQYHLALKQGTKLDTVAVGRFDEVGKASFTIPDKYTSFRGVGNLSVLTTGKNWNIILNSEDKIEIKEVAESDDITFRNSIENSSLGEMFSKQSKIMNSHNNPLDNTFSPFLSSEKQYESYLKEVNSSPLYAARMVELLNCLSGIGNKLTMPQEELFEGQRRFIVENINFKDLYTSGFWELAMDVWYQTLQDKDSLLVADSKKMLNRTDDILIRRQLTQSIIQQFSKYGKDNLLIELGTDYLTIPLNGQLAPEIKTNKEAFLPKSSLIVFYETGCGNCHYELENLNEKHALLLANNVRVISISADVDKDVYKENSALFMWKDRICDYKGFEGENFVNYGIVGTPTFILIDKEGIVRGRYARLKELIK